MKATSILPWILVLASGTAAAYFYNSNHNAKTRIAKLESEVSELTTLREQVTELKRFEFLEPEVERLKKENVEVHKLRNEVRYLKEESQQLAGQVQQQQAQNTSNASLQDLELQLQQLRSENESLRALSLQAQEASKTTEEHLAEYKDQCINNLRQLSGATEQWALENSKTIGEIPEYESLLSYLPAPPACPQGGSYTIAGVGKKPTCNMPEHQLP